MRIERALPSYFYTPQTAVPERQSDIAQPERAGGLGSWLNSPGVIVDISPQAQAAYARSKADSGGTQGVGAAQAPQECQTCKNRKYVDKSDDPSVSFQVPAHLSPGQAAASVMSHEQEHVSHEQAKAERDGRKVVSQTVALATSVCPECGRMYISGGVTRTITVKDNTAVKDNAEEFQV
jgi:ribosomal protein L32